MDIKDITEIAELIIKDIRNTYQDDKTVIQCLASGGLDYYGNMQKEDILVDELNKRLGLDDKTMDLEQYGEYYDTINPVVKSLAIDILEKEFGDCVVDGEQHKVYKHREVVRSVGLEDWEFISEQSESIQSIIIDSLERIRKNIEFASEDTNGILEKALFVLDKVINIKDKDEQIKYLLDLNNKLSDAYNIIISSLHDAIKETQIGIDSIKDQINFIEKNA